MPQLVVSRLAAGVLAASADGRYYPRYPYGNRIFQPGAGAQSYAGCTASLTLVSGPVLGTETGAELGTETGAILGP